MARAEQSQPCVGIPAWTTLPPALSYCLQAWCRNYASPAGWRQTGHTKADTPALQNPMIKAQCIQRESLIVIIIILMQPSAMTRSADAACALSCCCCEPALQLCELPRGPAQCTYYGVSCSPQVFPGAGLRAEVISVLCCLEQSR